MPGCAGGLSLLVPRVPGRHRVAAHLRDLRLPQRIQTNFRT